MQCTIATTPDWNKELYFWVQELTWVQASVYELSQREVELIKTCVLWQVQGLLLFYEATAPLVKHLPIK